MMRSKLNLLTLAVITILVLLNSCRSTRKEINQQEAAWRERCDGMTSLAWQTQIQGADAETTANIVTQLTAAAEADAKKSEDLKASGRIDTEFKSDIAKVINQNVNQASEVSDEFWEQENRYGETMCLFVSLLDREDFSSEKKNEILNNILTISQAHNDYVLNKKKLTNQ